MTNSNRFNSEAMKKSVAAFKRGLGNGAGAMAELAFMVEGAFTTGDTTSLVKALQASVERDDAYAKQVIGFITSQVWPGRKLSKDGKNNFVMKTKGIKPVQSALDVTLDLAKRDVSLRSGSTIRKAFQPDDAKAEKTFDVKDWAKRQAKAHPDAIDAMIAALQAQRGVNANAKTDTDFTTNSDGSKVDAVPLSRGQKAARTRAANKAAAAN